MSAFSPFYPYFCLVMTFSASDVARIYGKKIFFVENDEHARIVWRPKPDAKVTFFLSRAEYTNEPFMKLVKSIVDALQIPATAVGFGMVEGKPSLDDFFRQPTRFGLVFGILPESEHVRDDHDGQKELYVVPSVREMTQNRDCKIRAWNAMKKFKDRL
jgi:hypothetical protein